MNVLTLPGVAIASAMVITILGMGLFALVLSLYGVQVQAYAALALALFALSMAVTYATIERFIYQKVRIIYKNIHRFKSTKGRTKDVRMNEDVMEKVQQDVMDWAQERVQESPSSRSRRISARSSSTTWPMSSRPHLQHPGIHPHPARGRLRGPRPQSEIPDEGGQERGPHGRPDG